MKHFQRIGTGILTGAAIAIVAPTPAFAQTQVQDIRLVEMNGEVALVLVTRSGERPEVFVVRRGNDFVADIINTQLPAQKQNFQQNNPIPGIASVVVTQLDSTSVRVIVSGVNGSPEARIMQGSNEGIVISMGASAGAVAQVPNQVPNPPAPPPAPPAPPARSPQPVLVPDPQITIDGRNVPQSGIRPSDAAPPFLPRAVAPPLGDIAVSNVNAGVPAIRLNTTQRIPRLVLRDAPVSDVLALLARTAGLNLAISNLIKDDSNGEFRAPNDEKEQNQILGRKISLDIENESVEDVFNYVLRLSGLQANRVGNTIFVGVKLPTTANDIVVRSLRLNQVPAKSAAGFLSSQGAATQIQVDQVRIEQVGTGINSRYVETRTPTITELSAKESGSPLVLKGLSISTDDRLNSITLVGPPHLVETAVAMLTQMDLRQRQVAVNVKVVDVNLSGEEAASSSFSFGVNDTFFVNDGGAASVNFGGYNPPNRTTATSGINGRPIVPNPLSGQAPFYNRNGLAINPLTAPGGGVSLDPIAPVTERPGQVGVSDYTPFTRNLATGALTALGSTTNSLFPFFQYPRKFLSTLTAQIISGNAKILTDPTLVVQEGETAKVALVEEIVKSVTTTFVDTVSGTRDSKDFTFQNVGLTLDVNVQRIDDNGFVSMRINPTVSAPGDQVDAGGGDFARQILSRTVESGLIRLRDGQTLILSGIIQEQERATVSKIPLLGDLPIVGSLFRRTNKQNQRAEVIVLVTPQILDDSDRAPYGYEYSPSPDALRMMQRR
ncbi:AMIN domain-containing protein [Planktothrix agardhii 1029]|uniref:AMIN domain-containing protein n=2 Tax=Planktothrix agardhii TaxID=1160 RepID=UPI001D0ADD80|nr:AMIN domain-containing protein [Planktothrix agardhii]MCB8782782.1 AMIN domain-containing protein [Planktothrix agardhii 1808]MCB8764725.1 AMIN domain-containing protein [Planktothrix agardhii 1809]MCF3566190.1 AMIN domain-containing protein [Planktothrix agardhii 1807]MCF3588700.1 AMIN domain-containing protein [Planktothrix agardhii 1029]MCF3589376.1 AMIN domain-containing protein [Planktothrix agardhii 1029]